MSLEQSQAATELREAELVFGFVAPLGTPLDRIQKALIVELDSHGYALGTHVRISEHLAQQANLSATLPPDERQRQLMTLGNEKREKLGEDYLALVAIAAKSRSDYRK